MRCSRECSGELFPMPADMPPKTRGDVVTADERRLLQCPLCGALTRPHVLWFDETYNEAHYRFESSLRCAME